MYHKRLNAPVKSITLLCVLVVSRTFTLALISYLESHYHTITQVLISPHKNTHTHRKDTMKLLYTTLLSCAIGPLALDAANVGVRGSTGTGTQDSNTKTQVERSLKII